MSKATSRPRPVLVLGLKICLNLGHVLAYMGLGFVRKTLVISLKMRGFYLSSIKNWD